MGTKRRNRKLTAISSISSQQLLVICGRLNFFSIAFIAGASTTRVTVNDDNRLAHTAEHAFIGSLQKLFDQTLKVRKVEHRDSGNTVFIVIPQLDLDLCLRQRRK